MSLDSLLHFISSSGSGQREEADLAFAEVDGEGCITSINPFGRLAWGWRAGTQLDGDLKFALEGLRADDPQELPITLGGLHLRGLRFSDREGWFLIGHEPEQGPEAGQQVSFRSLMDRIPMPACSLNTHGHARFVNEAAATALGTSREELLGQPVLAELIHPEDRWKLAEIVELAAGEGSSHTTVRYSSGSQVGVLHVVQSVPDEYHAIILPLSGQQTPDEVAIVPETFYQSFLEQGPVGVVYLDHLGRVTFENHHFRSIVGSTPDDSWLGFPLTAVRVLDREDANNILETTSRGEKWTGPTTLKQTGNGRVSKHLFVHASPIRHPEGQFIGTALMIEDRTDLEHGRNAIENYERSESIKSALRELSAEHSNPTIFRERATKLIGEAFGANVATLLGLSIAKERLVDLVRWSDETTENESTSIPRSQLVMGEEQRFGRFLAKEEQNGMWLDDIAELWADPVRDNEQFAGYFLLGWKPGQRNPEWATEAKLNEVFRLFEGLYSGIQMASRYRTTVSAIDDALFGFAFTPDGGRRYHFVTDQIEILTGYHSSEVTGIVDSAQDWMKDLIHPEDAPRVRAHHRNLKDGHESRITYRIRHKDGTVRWLREHATPRTDATGLVAVNGILTDVSEQKEAELVLMQAKKEAETSDRSKTAFIATLSHEIRTPMGAVNGFAQLLEKELDDFEEELPYDLPDQVREFVAAISERSQKLLNLVDDLFELSNVEMGKASLRLRSADIAPLVQQTSAEHEAVAAEKGVDLHIHLPADECRAKVDEKRFRQVIDNLVSNAVKFTERGRIDVSLALRDEEWVVSVEDTGIGISEDYMERIFDPFSQEEEWKNRRFEGTGLGLALVRRLVDMMGGRINVDTRKGFGSTFEVAFPMISELDLPPMDRHAGGDGASGWSHRAFPAPGEGI